MKVKKIFADNKYLKKRKHKINFTTTKQGALYLSFFRKF